MSSGWVLAVWLWRRLSVLLAVPLDGWVAVARSWRGGFACALGSLLLARCLRKLADGKENVSLKDSIMKRFI